MRMEPFRNNEPTSEPASQGSVNELINVIINREETDWRQHSDNIFELELENEDESGQTIQLYAKLSSKQFGKDLINLYKIDLSTNFTSEGWLETDYYFYTSSAPGEWHIVKQSRLVNDQSTDEFFDALERQDMAALMENYQTYIQENLEQVGAMRMEKTLGLSGVSEEEIQKLIKYFETGRKIQS